MYHFPRFSSPLLAVFLSAAMAVNARPAEIDDLINMSATAIVANRVCGINTVKLRSDRQFGFEAAARKLGASRAFREIEEQASERIANSHPGEILDSVCKAMRERMY
ncbi:hypothetical protein EH240_13025 [Mesorhizobium tamadayense]|uniref:Uncharacterized protein n=1 Tax=Mesorhizobium tamadayense TaxID=425306 RepID=A0A3P3FUS1_9HYPH|nr:hypothetical protein [Mesorhizobium tamadayense]RRI02375.1 hypothetical protein EH240_13025 [Mesorhizobium tamadayense]